MLHRSPTAYAFSPRGLYGPWSVAALLLAACIGCGGSKAPAAKEQPAKVGTPVTEADLNTIKLTPEAERHLAIETAKVEPRASTACATMVAS